MKNTSLLRSSWFITAVAAVALATGVRAADADTEPDKSMTAAHESFAKKDMAGAAGHIHKAAAYVKQDSKKVAKDSKAAMKKVGDQLDKIGDGVKDGTVKSEAALKKSFASVDHQIADCWHKTAVETKKTGKDASADLKKAGDSLAGAAKWSGTKLSEAAHASIEGIKKASTATEGAAKTSAEEVNGWFKGIGDGIKDLGDKL